MNLSKKIVLLAMVSGLFASGLGMSVSYADAAKDAAAAEKEKASKNPYPNDSGPATISDLASYSAEEQAGYKLMTVKCAACHTPSRPLNSQFVDLKAPEIAQLKASKPELFQNKEIWQIEEGIWQRYVKRMMAKPGCNINTEDGKKIFKFLVAYSKKAKVTNSAAWKGHRGKLVSDFKQQHPDKYKEIFGK